MSLQLDIVSHSEIGLVRKNNQDSGYASPHLLVVADGMGGAAAGDLASAVAVDTIRRVDGPITGERMLEELAGALRRANDRIADLVDADYALEGMGTTVTTALFDGTEFGLAHIGDSRAYLLHDGHLERLTHDHSWVQSLVDDGKISEPEAAVHPHRSLLLKVLNGQPANDPDLTLVKVEAGDRLLLCSDGLCGLVDDPEIEQAMRLPDLQAALRRLVDEARAEGGIDNITVVLAEVMPSAPAQQPVVLGAAAERKIPATGTRTDGAVPEGLEGSQGDQPGASASASAGSASPGSAGTTLTGAGVGPGGTTAPSGRPAGAADQGDDEARYSPQPPAKRRFLRPLVGVLVLALVVGAGLSAAYAWTRTQFYVGADGEQVAIFQGLSDSVPGLSLSRLYEVQPLAVSALPPYYQDRVRASIDVANLAAARRTVGELSDAAKRCAAQSPAPRPNASVSTPSTVTTQPTATVGPKSSPDTSSTPRAPASAPSPASSSARPSPSATPDLSC